MPTNFAAGMSAETPARFPFLSHPRGVAVPVQSGLMKPDPEIFRLHAERLGLEPAATPVIDDAPANIAGAQGAGRRVIPFRDAEVPNCDAAERGIAA